MHDNSSTPLKDLTLRGGRFAPKPNAFNGRDRARSKTRGRRLGANKTSPTGGHSPTSGPPPISGRYANALAVDKYERGNFRDRKRLQDSNAAGSYRKSKRAAQDFSGPHGNPSMAADDPKAEGREVEAVGDSKAEPLHAPVAGHKGASRRTAAVADQRRKDKISPAEADMAMVAASLVVANSANAR